MKWLRSFLLIAGIVLLLLNTIGLFKSLRNEDLYAEITPYKNDISIEEARNDYMDIHGGNRELPLDAVDNLVAGIKRVYTGIEKIENAPEQQFLNNLAKS